MFIDRTCRISAVRHHAATIPLLALVFAAAASAASAATLCVAPGGIYGCRSTISAAVAAASPGDVIRVWPGEYKEQVTITKPLSVVAATAAAPLINAQGRANGFFINGMSAAPNAGVANVVVSGFKVRNANFEGILLVNAAGAAILDNYVSYNNKALDPANAVCNGIAKFETNENQDCGEGIHLIATDHSTIARNEVFSNSGGILITDETGTNHDNLVTENYVHDNPYACGITIASHPPATSIIPSAEVSFGIMHDTIKGNWSWHNGLGLPGAGAGVGIFAPGPGSTAAANIVTGNDIRGNALPGVTMHNHAWLAAPAPPVNLNDNMIVGNYISGNAADTEDAATPGTAGFNLFSLAPVTGTIVSQNRFDHEAIDVVFNAPSGQLIAHLNDFAPGIGVDNLGKGTVDATENWWGCVNGPGAAHCATVAGAGVTFAPWSWFAFTGGQP